MSDDARGAAEPGPPEVYLPEPVPGATPTPQPTPPQSPVAPPAATGPVPTPTPGWEPPVAPPAPAANDAWAPALSPLETLDPRADVVPVEEARPRRSTRPWLIGTAVAAVLVLVLGGVAAALLLNRPDVRLQRALSAVQDRPTGSLVMSVDISDAGDPTTQEMLDSGALRMAWDKPGDAQQLTFTMDGKTVVDVVIAHDHVVLTQDLALLPLPDVESAMAQLKDVAAAMGPDGKALADFADGVPLRVNTGEGSALGSLLEQAQSAGGQAPPDEQKVAAAAERIQAAVRDNITVTDAGSDQYGDHLQASVPLAPVLTEMFRAFSEISGQSVPADVTSALDEVPTLRLDFWVNDGVVTRMEAPLSAMMREAGAPAGTPDITLVLEVSDDGVHEPTGTVAELPDSLFEDLGGGLLGGLGSGGGL